MIRWPRRGWGLVALGLLLRVGHSRAAGRWIVHVPTHPPAGSVSSRPSDMLAAPETVGHWVWVVWYDPIAGAWGYDTARPYVFSNGVVPFMPPQYGRWYYVLFYDTALGIFL